MRLLNINTYQLREFQGRTRPAYAITSHRWGDEEVTFDEISGDLSPARKQLLYAKNGYMKIQGFSAAAKTLLGSEGIEWIWIDTCCIDKRNSSELSEALNSMFRWYKEARMCFAYLHDVNFEAEREQSAMNAWTFGNSEWFRRGWTLQELIAPKSVQFLDCGWRPIGYKTGGSPSISTDQTLHGGNLNELIADVTGIPGHVIEDLSSAEHLSLGQKGSWMEHRETTRVEDKAYCQLGIFGVFMPPIYGEGENAFNRLEEEIEKSLIRKAARSGIDISQLREGSSVPNTLDYPDLGIAIAKFTFDTPQPGDLGFRKGDAIRIIIKSDNENDWWTGKIGANRGTFPANYVDPVAKPGQAIALFSFDPEQCAAGDLTFRRGDVITIIQKDDETDNWWRGRMGDREGMFPANYVQVL